MKSAKDMAGFTFCIPAVGSASQAIIQAWAMKAGVDYTKGPYFAANGDFSASASQMSAFSNA